MTNNDAAIRAARVREAMLDGVLGEAFDAIEQEYARSLLECYEGPEARERLWLAVQIVRKVRGQLSTWSASAVMADHRAAEIKRLHAAR